MSLHAGTRDNRLLRWSVGRLVILLAMVFAAWSAAAVEPDELLANPVLEARARALSAELRCLVCQNQSIDDSNASLARDLRILVRDRIKAGDSDEAVRAFVVSRYGEFVLLRPPVGPNTLLLWATPALLILIALGVLAMSANRARHRAPTSAPLDEAEQAKLDAVLANMDAGSPAPGGARESRASGAAPPAASR